MDKKTLRTQISQQKQALTAPQIEAASENLAAQLFAHPLYQAATAIYGYLSFNQEVRTAPILRRAQRDGKRVAVPKIENGVMRFFWLDDLDAVAPGFYGIPEPGEGARVAEDEDALILMPGLAFDGRGYRVGYGGGYYDRYLARHPDHPTLALCYDFQIVEEVPVDEHDIPVQLMLTAPTVGP